jgi:hypothetical protein
MLSSVLKLRTALRHPNSSTRKRNFNAFSLDRGNGKDSWAVDFRREVPDASRQAKAAPSID